MILEPEGRSPDGSDNFSLEEQNTPKEDALHTRASFLYTFIII